MGYDCDMKMLILAIFLLISVPSSLADAPGEPGGDAQREDWVVNKEPSGAGPKGSDASFDKRLPPVYPGERINDSGKPARVWSTSGSVDGGGAKEDSNSAKTKIPNIDVIIDGRRALPGRVHGTDSR